ncbi:MAG: hypothetical protein IJ660_05415 [Alphaproteobacteria bacterium]|nr:hypothetical protein [Alphaproteobacteria bacterium]
MKKIILVCAILLCVSCTKKVTPTLEEQKLPSLIEQSQGEIDYENSDIVTTLLTVGTHLQGFGGASASVAYLLLKNDSVLIIAPQNIQPPFTKDEARLLMKSKLRGEMLLFD